MTRFVLGVVLLVVALRALAATCPLVVRLFSGTVPLVVVVSAVIVVLRLIWYFTNRY